MCSILFMYALYKPCDKIKLFSDTDDEIPKFARIFFEKVENCEILAKIFKY
jgi:hypothetical protein